MSLEIIMEKLKKYWLVLAKYYLKPTALVRYCIEPFQTNPENENLNDNKPVLKIPLVLTVIKLDFFIIQKEKVKKAATWILRVYAAVRFHHI